MIYLIPDALEILNNLPHDDEYIFTRNGERLTSRQINYVLEKYAERNGLKTKSSHKLRKTYASMCNAKGVPIDFIREQLGHASLSTTYGYIYNPLTEKETYEALTKALSSDKALGDPKPSEAENIIAFDEKRLKNALSPNCPQIYEQNKAAETLIFQRFRYLLDERETGIEVGHTRKNPVKSRRKALYPRVVPKTVPKMMGTTLILAHENPQEIKHHVSCRCRRI